MRVGFLSAAIVAIAISSLVAYWFFADSQQETERELMQAIELCASIDAGWEKGSNCKVDSANKILISSFRGNQKQARDFCDEVVDVISNVRTISGDDKYLDSAWQFAVQTDSLSGETFIKCQFEQ